MNVSWAGISSGRASAASCVVMVTPDGVIRFGGSVTPSTTVLCMIIVPAPIVQLRTRERKPKKLKSPTSESSIAAWWAIETMAPKVKFAVLAVR